MANKGARYPTGKILKYVLDNGKQHRLGKSGMSLESMGDVEQGTQVEIAVNVGKDGEKLDKAVYEKWQVDEVQRGSPPYAGWKRYKMKRISGK